MPEPITRLEDVRTDHNVVAAFADAEAARAAIESLGEAGIDAGDISLLGARPAGPDDPTGEALGHVATRAAEGAGVGAAAGGLAGLAITSIAIPGLGPLLGAGLWAIAGGTAGGIVGAVTDLGISEAWEFTFANLEQDRVCVGVHAADGATIDEAAEVLAGHEPLDLERFGDAP